MQAIAFVALGCKLRHHKIVPLCLLLQHCDIVVHEHPLFVLKFPHMLKPTAGCKGDQDFVLILSEWIAGIL